MSRVPQSRQSSRSVIKQRVKKPVITRIRQPVHKPLNLLLDKIKVTPDHSTISSPLYPHRINLISDHDQFRLRNVAWTRGNRSGRRVNSFVFVSQPILWDVLLLHTPLPGIYLVSVRNLESFFQLFLYWNVWQFCYRHSLLKISVIDLNKNFSKLPTIEIIIKI